MSKLNWKKTHALTHFTAARRKECVRLPKAAVEKRKPEAMSSGDVKRATIKRSPPSKRKLRMPVYSIQQKVFD